MKRILTVILCLLTIIVSFNCGSSKEMKTTSKRKVKYYTSLDNDFEIMVQRFNINGYRIKNRDIWVFTSNWIFFNNPEIGLRKFISLDTNRPEIKVLIDSIKAVSTRITENIKPGLYDNNTRPLSDSFYAGINSQQRFINSGISFNFRKGFENIKSFELYVIFKCEQKEFYALLSMFKKITKLSIDPNFTFLLDRIFHLGISSFEDGLECKRFEIQRVFIE